MGVQARATLPIHSYPVRSSSGRLLFVIGLLSVSLKLQLLS